MTTASEKVRKPQDEISDVVKEELAWQAKWGKPLYRGFVGFMAAAAALLLGLLYSGQFS